MYRASPRQSLRMSRWRRSSRRTLPFTANGSAPWRGTSMPTSGRKSRAICCARIAKRGTGQEGQLLFEIDPRPFRAALDQAQGQLAQARAQLANAEAVQRRTQLDVERYIPLAKEQAASQQDLDNAIQNNLAAKATVATAEAQIKTAGAALETAKLNLGFTQLTAPISGIAGQAQLQVGALVSTSGTAVTTVSTLDPIRDYFTVSEQDYIELQK